jgi:hypothetical protein
MATLYSEEDLNKIILQCPDEKTYPSPEIMVDETGKRLYAYVTLVMLGDSYIPAAIVMAHTVRLLQSNADLVVLVTNDVSVEGKQILSMFFDRVIDVKYITVPNWRTKKQSHRKYLELVFTKFHIFNLTQYKKVLLIDADALVLKYPDHLFTLDAPAGCFLENKDLFISYDSKGNYILPPTGKIEWYDKYCKCCGHGKKIPKENTDRVLTDAKNSGIGGGLILLEPNAKELNSIIFDVTHGKMKYLINNKFVWPEQQYLTARYSGKWTSMNPRFFGLQGYPHWKVLYGLQYGGDKPFVLNSKMNINERIQYPDYVLWHEYYQNILDKYPSISNSTVLKECNEMHKYFKNKSTIASVQSRYNTFKHSNDMKDKIGKLYKVSEHRVHNQQIEYYHTNYNTMFRPVNLIKPMYENIKEYDYMEPIKKLNIYFKNEKTMYYKNIVETVIIPEIKEPLHIYDIVDPIDRDEIMLQYIKCRNKCFVITVWPTATKKINEIVSYLNSKGNIYYVKEIDLSKDGIRNLMFMMYDEFTTSEKLIFIEKKLEYIGCNSCSNKVAFIIFDNVQNHKLAGQGAPFKKEIRNKVAEIINKQNVWGNDLIHINDYFYQTIEYCQTILNDNSINLINNQDVRRYTGEHMRESHLKLQTFRNWVYTNMTIEERTKLCLMGSTVLYAYGIRKSNDIDGILISNTSSEVNSTTNESEAEAELNEALYINFYDKKSKFPFADIGIEGSKYWRESWTLKNNNIYNAFQISAFADIVANPRYHMYFQGMKLYLLDHEIVRKILRHGEQDYADFIMMYFYWRLQLGHYIYLDKNNKMHFFNSYDELFDKHSDHLVQLISGEFRKKYLPKEYTEITDNVIKHLFITQ